MAPFLAARISLMTAMKSLELFSNAIKQQAATNPVLPKPPKQCTITTSPSCKAVVNLSISYKYQDILGITFSNSSKSCGIWPSNILKKVNIEVFTSDGKYDVIYSKFFAFIEYVLNVNLNMLSSSVIIFGCNEIKYHFVF